MSPNEAPTGTSTLPRVFPLRRTTWQHGAPVALWLLALFVVLIMILPLAYLILRASQGGMDLIEILWRQRTLMLLRNTVTLSFLVTLASVAISLPLVWLTTRTDLPWRRFWSVATNLPLVIPSYVGALAVVSALGPRGLLQGWLESWFGIERLPEIYGLFGATLTLTLLSYPYVALALRGAISGLDPALEEASRSMGYGAWSTFWRVTLPQLRPALAAGSLLVSLYVLSDFGAVSLLQFDAFTRAIYSQYRGAFDRTVAAGLALILVALTLFILGLEARSRGHSRYHRSTAGSIRPTQLVKLGRWKPLAVGYCALVTSVALVIPVAVIGYWMVRGLRAGESLQVVWSATWNSTLVSLLAAVVAVLAALPFVILSVRYPGRMSGLVERLAYAGYALPGIVVALSLVFFGANYAPLIYQTMFILVLAYVIRFLPQAIGTIRAAMLQVGPHVEDAARSLGYSSPAVWARVTGPLIRSGLLSGGALVFLTVMKELPATLLLRPIGFETLATRIWSATAEGFWTRASGPALLLILVAAIPMIFVSWRQSAPDR